MRNLCRLCFILLGLFASVLIILIYCFIIILLLCSLSLARGRRRWRHPSPPPLKTHVLDGTFPIKFCCPRAFLGGVCSTWRVFLHNKVFDKNVLKKGWVWTTTGAQAGAGATWTRTRGYPAWAWAINCTSIATMASCHRWGNTTISFKLNGELVGQYNDINNAPVALLLIYCWPNIMVKLHVSVSAGPILAWMT